MSSPDCRITVAGLEAVAARGWRGTETEALGGWLLRAAGGFTGRANSALPLGDPGLPVGPAIGRVEEWYAARGLSPRFLLPLPDAQAVDDELAARGWPLGDVVRVLVAPVAGLAAGGAADRAAGRPAVRLDDRPDDAWVAAYHYRGGVLPPHARQVIEHGDTLAFASVRDAAGRVLAIARGSVDDDIDADADADADGVGWLGVTAVEVEPASRRQGLGGVILRGLAGWAQERDARCCYLQVAADNAPALALYAGAGFAEHHTYQYRLAPG
ncbi:MAG: GNAT family N-acetyltransferase [Actinomycetes bacterium]